MKIRTHKMLALLLTAALLCGVLSAHFALPAVAKGELFGDVGFENGDLSGWTVPAWCAAGVSVGTAYAKNGNYGVSITGNWSNIQRVVSVKPNTDYQLSFWVKGCGVVYFKTASGDEIKTVWAADHAQWTAVSYTVNSGDNTALHVEINCAESRAWVDDLRFAPVVDNHVTGGLGCVTESDGMIGVGFRFSLKAQVVTEGHTFVSGTVEPVEGQRYPLVGMGAVVTNCSSLIEDLTLDKVDNDTCQNVPAKLVNEVTATSVSFAVRVINIPIAAKGYAVYARPYYVYLDGEEEVVVYAPAVYEESYLTIADRVNYTDNSKWELCWNDEFGGDTLDSSKWNMAHYPGSIQYNTNRPENVRVEGGDLVITARKENYEGKEYTTGGVTSDYKFSVLYGRIEIRAKLAWGKGVWPALWTMGDLYLERGDTDGWPYAGEIDILELVGETDVVKKANGSYVHTTNKYNEANRTATHNIHWGPDRDNHCEVGGLGLKGYQSKYLYPVANHPADGYHIYALEWDYRDLKFFIDDIEVGHIWWDDTYIYSRNGNSAVYSERLRSYRQGDGSTGTTAADLDRAFSDPANPHWLIMGVGLCEGWTETGVNTTDGTDLPASMYVDYVRVYQRKDVNE